MFRSFADWIAATPLNHTLQVYADWVVPTSQSLHIISVGVLFTAALRINMRLLGAANAEHTVSRLTEAMAPWMWGALGVLMLTGTVQTIAEPVRQFITPVFWSKMVMIVIVMAMTAMFIGKVRSNAPRWDTAGPRPAGARQFAVISSLLWIAIIACGRFIGYTWPFYL